MRVAVFGDASGWLAPTLDALRRLGVGTDLEQFSWPEDLTVVHVGDLVHKGPDGDALVAWVDEVMDRVGERWKQALGNHEARYLSGPSFSGRDGVYELDGETVATLQRWLLHDRARLAFALRDSDGEDWLVTHSGVTRATWAALGCPASATATAGALNRLLTTDPVTALQAGGMLGLPTEPGVVWAAPEEVYSSWWGRSMAWSQVHGHTTPYHWDRNGFVGELRFELRQAAFEATSDTDEANRHLRVPLGGRTVLAVDPGFGSRPPTRPLVPLVLEGEVLADEPGVAVAAGEAGEGAGEGLPRESPPSSSLEDRALDRRRDD